MNIELQPSGDGVLLPVRVHAGAGSNELRGEQDGALKVAVTQAPEKGKANKAVVELLAKQLGLRKSQIEVIAGHHSPRKQLLIRAVSVGQLATLLARALEL